jgi:hypothetical protein
MAAPLFPVDYVTFTFDGPRTAFGIDINPQTTSLNGGHSATLDLDDAIDDVIDPFPGFQTGEFVGFSSTVPFTSVTIRAPLDGDNISLNSLRAGPEPGTVVLFRIALLGLALSTRATARS